jgi:hypothetical protein
LGNGSFTPVHLGAILSREVGVDGCGRIPIWPPEGTLKWPPPNALDDAAYERLALGQSLSTTLPHTTTGPWTPAVDLPGSRLERGRNEISCRYSDL